MRIQLLWTDPNSGQAYQPVFALPIAIGRSFGLMPGTINGEAVSRVVLANDQVEIYHALLAEQDGAVIVTGQSDAALSVNGVAFKTVPLQEGDRIQIGPFELEFKLAIEEETPEEPPAVPMEPETFLPPPISPPENSPAFAQRAPEPPTSPTPTPVSSSGAELVSGLSGTAMGTEPSAGWRCDRKVGFLFKRMCDRTTPKGCPHCRNGQVNDDPYFYDYDLYPGYGRYGRGYWGYGYYRDRDRYYYNSDTRDVDFTEADAASFEDETDTDYEMGYGDS